MRRVSYLSVLNRFFSAVGDPDGSTELGAIGNTWINRRLVFAWEYYWWPELTPVEKRYFRDVWDSSTTYSASTQSAPVEVYHPGSQKYYQSLQGSNTNHAPATYSGGSWVENSQWWAECKASYSGSDWADATAYTVGQIIRRGDGSGSGVDHEYYQCHTAHTSSSSFDTSKFNILTPFVRYIANEQTGKTVIGDVRAAWDRNPKIDPGAVKLGKQIYDDGVVVRGTQPEVYLEFRKRAGEFTGANYSAATTYAADDQVYDSTTGDYYKSLAGSNLGNAVTDTNYWERIDFPFIFREYCAQGAASDYLLKSEDRMVRYESDRDEARILLIRELDKLERQQGQARQLNVVR